MQQSSAIIVNLLSLNKIKSIVVFREFDELNTSTIESGILPDLISHCL